MIFFKVYQDRKGVLASIEEFINIFKAGFFATVLILASMVVFGIYPGSRYVLIYAFIINIVSITLIHHFRYQILKIRPEEKLHKVMILGTDELSQALYERLLFEKKHHYAVIGAVGEQPKKIIYSLENSFNYLGDYDVIWDYVDLHKLKEIFISTTALTRRQMSDLIDPLIDKGIQIRMIPSFYDLVSNKIEATIDIGFPLFSIKRNTLTKKQFIIKRALDVFLALIILVITSPIMLFVVIALKLENKGGVIYKQERVGLNSKIFTMYKFRTMPAGIEKETGPVIQAIGENTRATKFGKFLRKTSVDELPQIFNILKGEMSIVGPRPERLFFVEQFIKDIPDFDKRHRVLPGVTGWAQINGRAALSTRVDEKLMYDLYYINNWSLVFDIKILIKTIGKVLVWQGAN